MHSAPSLIPTTTYSPREISRSRPRGGYSGASVQDSNIALWRPGLTSVDSEILRDGPELRARARDLERNHPFARQAVRTSRLGVIGKQLRYSCRPDWRFLGIDQEEAIRWGQEWERVWENYAHSPRFHIDAGRRLTFSQMMQLVHDSDFVDGEFFIAAEWAPNRKWSSCFHVIDVDRLSNPHGYPESVSRKGGVELDEFGAPVGYHIRNAHPGDIGVLGSDYMTWGFVPRESEWGRLIGAHGFDMHRAGQTRGRTEFASVITAMKMGAEYVENELAAAILQASYAAVVESQANYRDAMEAIGMGTEATKVNAQTVIDLAEQNLEAAVAWHEATNIRFQGSKAMKLFPGEKFNLLTTGNRASSLGEFQAQATKSYAAGTGTDPIGVSQDYSNVNYSSAKMSQATTYRHYETKRERLSMTAALPMVGNVLEEAVFSGAMPLPKGLSPSDFYDARDALIAGKFLAQGAPNLDPVKEAQALQLRLQMGLDTLQDAAAREGNDYRDIIAQRATERRETTASGLGEPNYGPAPNSLPGNGPENGAPEMEE